MRGKQEKTKLFVSATEKLSDVPASCLSSTIWAGVKEQREGQQQNE